MNDSEMFEKIPNIPITKKEREEIISVIKGLDIDRNMKNKLYKLGKAMLQKDKWKKSQTFSPSSNTL